MPRLALTLVLLLVGSCGYIDNPAYGSPGGSRPNTSSGEASGSEVTTEGEQTQTGETAEGADTSGGEDASDEVGTAETGDLLMPNIDMPNISECDPFAQDCPEGEKCMPYGSTEGSWNANKCVPVSGAGQAGEQCIYNGSVEATDSCGDDTHCWDLMDVGGMSVGVCRPFCIGTVDQPMCGPGEACSIVSGGVITLCLPTCDPALQDCEADFGCYWAHGNFTCVPTTQDLWLGEPCELASDCAAGMDCLSVELLSDCAEASCCGGYCDLTDPYCEDGWTECLPMFEEGDEPPGLEHVGVCINP